MSPTTRLHLVELSPDECWRRLGSTSIGRVAVTMGALPLILPVVFGVLDRTVVFRVVPGTTLHAAAVGNVVAFEADEMRTDHGDGWSVVVQGIAREITDAAQLERSEALALAATTESADSRAVRVSAGIVTGRAVTFGSAGPP